MKVRLLLLLVILAPYLFSQEEEPLPPGGDESSEQVYQVDESKYKITGESEEAEGSAIPGVEIREYLTVILVLVFVIIALYVVLRFLKKVGGNRIGLDNDQIKVISTKVLKGTTALHLVEVGTQVFLIGATDNSINGISEITDKESLDTIRLESTRDEGIQNTFFQLFSNKLKRGEAPKAEENLQDSLSIDKDRLNKF